MGIRAGLNILLSLCLALGLTFFVYSVDIHYAEKYRIEAASQLSKQIATQTEILALYGRDHGEDSPLSWAARAFSGSSEGAEGKLVQVRAIRIGHRVDDKTESTFFDPKTGSFHYVRIVSPDTNEGFRVQIQLGYLGFLGAKNKVFNDLFVGILFFFIFIFCVFIISLAMGKKPTSVVQSLESAEQEHRRDVLIQKTLGEWSHSVRESLIQVGMHLKGVYQEAIQVSSQANKTVETVQTIQKLSLSMRDTSEALGKAVEVLKRFEAKAQKDHLEPEAKNADSIK